MSDGIPLDQLEVGKLYRGEMDDCCVQGWFVSRLTASVTAQPRRRASAQRGSRSELPDSATTGMS